MELGRTPLAKRPSQKKLGKTETASNKGNFFMGRVQYKFHQEVFTDINNSDSILRKYGILRNTIALGEMSIGSRSRAQKAGAIRNFDPEEFSKHDLE